MARVGSFTSRAHADMAAGMLTARGIPARTAADDAGGAAPHIALGAHGFAVEVPDHQADEALALLQEATADAASRPTGWRRAVTRTFAWTILLMIAVGFVYAATR